MATGGDFDRGGDAVGSDSSEEERTTSGSDDCIVLNINASILQIGGDNLLKFRSVDDVVPSVNPSKIKNSDEGGAVLRELCKPHGLLSGGRSRLRLPDISESVSGEEERASSRGENAIVMSVANPCFMQISSDNVPNVSPVDNSTQSGDSSEIKSDNDGQPVLREHWKPLGLLSVGRSRLGFPDCDNDHLVQLLVCKNQHTREVLDIAGHYNVTVAVSYNVTDEPSLKLPDYQCERIKTKTDTNGSAMIGVIGYLFRFHEPHTKYTIRFSLNAIPPKRRGKTTSLKEHAACETICQISVTLETGPMMSSKSGKIKKKAREITVSPLLVFSPLSFSKESNVLYKRSWWVVNRLWSCRKNAKWEDFDELASDLLLKFTDADTQITIKLEQSKKLHYQNQPDRALQLIDDAFNFMSEAENPQLMAGRSYFYKAEILRRQGSLGEAEYSVNLAGQNIAACETGLDTGLIAWERARILTDFIEQTPHRSLKLVNEARSNLEKCIDVCQHVETETSNFQAKQFFVIVLLGMTILLLDCDSDVGRKRSVPKEFIAKAQWCLDTLRNKYWSEMTLFDRVYFYMSSSDLEYRRSNYKESEEFARLAKDKAVEMGLNTEASQTQKRLDFLRVITSGQTIDNGPQQSESEGENADISSSEADSDWLTAILN